MRRRVALVAALLLAACLLASGAPAVAQNRKAIDERTRNPVVYVHGFNSSGCMWDDESVRGTLKAAGHPSSQEMVVNNGREDCDSAKLGKEDPSEGDFTSRDVQRKLDAAIHAALEASETGYVDIVARSMGGLVSRWYLNHSGMAAHVRTLVMIATPNHGSFGALASRLSTLYEDPEWFNFSSRDKQQIQEWADYVVQWWDNRPMWSSETFSEWMAKDSTRSAMFAGMMEKSIKPSVGRGDRYTRQFEEYLLALQGMVEGREAIRKKMNWFSREVAVPIATTLDQVDENLALWASRNQATADPYSIAIDRLLPEYIWVPAGVSAKGKPVPRAIPVNPTILKLNAVDRMNRGRSSAIRYVMVAGIAEWDSMKGLKEQPWVAIASSFGSQAVVSGVYQIQPNDMIVEWNSVYLPYWGGDQFYLYWGAKEAQHGDLVSNSQVKEWVNKELDGSAFFPNPINITVGPGRSLRTGWTSIQSGIPVLVSVQRAQGDQAGNEKLLIRSSGYDQPLPKWIFLEDHDLKLRVVAASGESATRYFWTGDPRLYRRVAVMTPNPPVIRLPASMRQERWKVPGGQVFIWYDKGDDVEPVIAAVQDRYEVAVTQVDAANYPVVTALISVREKYSGPVKGLSTKDFWLEDSGVQLAKFQVASSSERYVRKAKDVVLVLDYSHSMKGAPLRESQDAAAVFIDLLDHDIDRVAIIKFARAPELLTPLTRDFRGAQQLLKGDSLPSTNIYDSLLLALEQLEGSKERQGIVLLTDGGHNSGKASREQAMTAATKAGVPIFVIGLGQGIEYAALRELAEVTGGETYFASDITRLFYLYHALNESVMRDYKVTYLAPDRPGDERFVRIGLRSFSSNAESKRGYQVRGKGDER